MRVANIRLSSMKITYSSGRKVEKAKPAQMNSRITASAMNILRSPILSVRAPKVCRKTTPSAAATSASAAITAGLAPYCVTSTQGAKVRKICLRAPKRMFSR